MDREIESGVRRRRTLKRVAWVVGTVVAIGLLYFQAIRWLSPSVHRAEVRVGSVTRGDIEATVQASGRVVPAFERVIASPVEARVMRLLRRPGAVLAAGDPILELDTAATRLALEEAEERIAQNANDRRQEQLALDKSLAALEVEVASREMDAEIAGYALEQQENLHLEGLTSDGELKRAQVAADKATILSRQSREEIERERLANAAKLERLELDARILRRERDDLRRKLELADTRAQEPGVLTWVVEEVGAVVPSGGVLARVANLDSFRIEATVSDAYAPRLELGQRCHVLAGGETLAGTLVNIRPTIENGALRFQVDLDDASDAILRHNLKVDVLVVTGARSNVLLAPRGPYIRGGGSNHQVFVVRGEDAVRVDVEIGLVGHEHFEVKSGLQEDDELILSDMRTKIHARRLTVR